MFLDPNSAYVILVVAFILATLSLAAPGTGILEIGSVALMAFSGYALFQLTFNVWALVILLIGLPFFFLALRPGPSWRQWLFLILSLICYWAGSFFLFISPSGSQAINPYLALFVSIFAGGFMWFIFHKSIEASRIPVKQTLSASKGQEGLALTDIGMEGSVLINSENWSATSQKKISKHSKVRVVGRKGLILEVEEIK
jgi:membrane-bound ClpP family serine protease